MGSLCCFPCRGSTKVSAKYSDAGEESLDSEPYSPQTMDFLTIAEAIGVGSKEEGEPPGCPPCSPILESPENHSYGIDDAAVGSREEEIQSVLRVPQEHEGVVDPEKSPQSKTSCGSDDGCCVSHADSEKTYRTSSAISPIDHEYKSKPPVKSGTVFERSSVASFRWDHVNEEPSRTDKTIERGKERRSVQKSDNATISRGQCKVHRNGSSNTSSGWKDECQTLGWYIHVTRTGQCILNHHQLRPIMDELKNWSMQVPGTVSLRYKHTNGMDVLLPWPDLRTGSKQEIEKFVETVNRIERRKVFYYLFMEHPLSFPKYMPPCVPPPSPTSANKHKVQKSVLIRNSRSLRK